MSGTNVPAPTFGATGLVVPAESAILAGRQADINAAFGGAVNQALTTSQGQLAQSESAIIGNCNNQLLAVVAGCDPAYSSGRMQDGIGRIYFMTRIPGTSTVVSVLCSGLYNVSIAAGAMLQAEDGNNYACTQAGTIPLSGSITLPFACAVTGPIACPAQTFTIVQTVSGWDSAVSSAAGVIGSNVETASAFEMRRQASVQSNSIGVLPAIRGAVLALVGVTDCYCTENFTTAPVTVGGVSIAPNSIYVCVNGGLASAIGQAIWSKKPPGCGYTGNTSVTVYDTNSGYSPPLPSYIVTYEVPVLTSIYFAVSITNSASVPTNGAALVQAAIVSAFAGNFNGIPRATIGATIYGMQFVAAVAAIAAWAGNVISITVGSGASPTTTDVTTDINQMPVISASNISVTFI